MNRLAVFASVHQAIKAERLLRSHGLTVDLIPTPREISASCGQSLLFAAADLPVALELMETCGVSCQGIYAADRENRVFELLTGKGAGSWSST